MDVNKSDHLLKRKFVDDSDQESNKKIRIEDSNENDYFKTTEIIFEGEVIYKTNIINNQNTNKPINLYYYVKDYHKYITRKLVDDFVSKTDSNNDEMILNKSQLEMILLPDAIKTNNIVYYYYLGRMFACIYNKTNNTDDRAKAIKYLEIAKNNGIINSYIHLFWCYYVSKDYEKFNSLIDMTLKYENVLNTGVIYLYDLTCRYFLHIKKDCENKYYLLSVDALKQKNSQLYHFFNAHIYKDKDPEKFLQLLYEGAYQNCLKCSLIYGHAILNKFIFENYLNFDKLSEATIFIEKCINYKFISDEQAHDIYHRIYTIHTRLGNIGYQIFYLEKIFYKYKCIKSGIELVKYYHKINNNGKVTELENKLVELNCVPVIMNQINRSQTEKNFTKYISLVLKLKYLDSREYQKHRNKLNETITKNNFVSKKYPDKSFECPITLEKLPVSIVLKCCNKEIGCWFLLSKPSEFKCPYCRNKFKH